MKRISAYLITSLVAACGGGGGADSGPAPTAPPPANVAAAAAMQALLKTARTVTASGVASDGRTYTLTYTVVPKGSGTLGGGTTPVDLTEFTAILRTGGAVTSSASTTWYAQQGTNLIAAVRRSDGACGTAASPSQPPSSAALLSGGPLYATDIYPTCSSADFSFERETATWSIESEGSLAYFCARVQFSGLGASGGGGTQQVCIQSSSTGTLGPSVRVTLTQGTTFSVVLRA